MDFSSIVKLVPIATGFMMAGYGINASQSGMPMLYSQPASVSTPLFKAIYHNGTAVLGPAAVLSASVCGYLAYQYPEQRRNWATAGALVFAIGPFTQLVMISGINRLLEISGSTAAEQTKAQASGEVLRLLKAWNVQNFVRIGFNFSSGLIALLAARNSGF